MNVGGIEKQFHHFQATTLPAITEKVTDFVRRYWADILVYTLSMAAVYLANQYSPGLGHAVQMGVPLIWTLKNTDGERQATDFLVRVGRHTSRPIPESRSEDHATICRILKRRPTDSVPYGGWVLIHGPSGIGKSESAVTMSTNS